MNKKLLMKIVYVFSTLIIGGIWYYLFNQFSNPFNYNYVEYLNLLLFVGFLFFVSISLLITSWPVNLSLGTTLGSIYIIIFASRLLKWDNFNVVVQPKILIGGIILIPSIALLSVTFFYKYVVGEASR